MAVEVIEQKKLSLRLGYEWLHYKIRESFLNFQCHTDLLNFARSAVILKNYETNVVVNIKYCEPNENVCHD